MRSPTGEEHWTRGTFVEVDGISHQISQDEAGVVRTPAPAVVVAVPVAVGDEHVARQRDLGHLRRQHQPGRVDFPRRGFGTSGLNC